MVLTSGKSEKAWNEQRPEGNENQSQFGHSGCKGNVCALFLVNFPCSKIFVLKYNGSPRKQTTSESEKAVYNWSCDALIMEITSCTHYCVQQY